MIYQHCLYSCLKRVNGFFLKFLDFEPGDLYVSELCLQEKEKRNSDRETAREREREREIEREREKERVIERERERERERENWRAREGGKERKRK